MAASSRITPALMLQIGPKIGGPPFRSSGIHRQCIRVRAAAHEGFRDEGRRSGKQIDEANLRLLREKMEVIKVKESLERVIEDYEHRQLLNEAGWSYINVNDNYEPFHDREKKYWKLQLSEFMEVLMMGFGTFGFTVASGTLCLCLASVLVHFMNQ
ncbi:OLC1v1010675C1 [Oldenlandia corymbosa var. corymbosa]|uniref:OLC1v1010675C1 n=1 Tax=Oldenlandia corymbosa var. corymbosa TaxID=529605 RepID=A0AAV1DRT9_OLDCO|nr:OLC1v1010675C1 [Oldenlandia corymbosa var. corymbosa]